MQCSKTCQGNKTEENENKATYLCNVSRDEIKAE